LRQALLGSSPSMDSLIALNSQMQHILFTVAKDQKVLNELRDGLIGAYFGNVVTSG